MKSPTLPFAAMLLGGIVLGGILLGQKWHGAHETIAPSAETEAEALERGRAATAAHDYATSLAIYRDLMRNGSGAGTRFLGLMYMSGAGVSADRQQACG